MKQLTRSIIHNNFYRVSIKALILDKQKRFLLCLEENGLWELPGGGMDFGEKPDECIKRELKEEMGLEVDTIKDNPSYFVSALNINKVWKVEAIYETKVKDLNFTPSDECVEIKFFTKEEALKENLYPIVREFLNVFDPNNH